MIQNGCDSFSDLCAMVSAGASTHEEERALKEHLQSGCNPCAAYLRAMDETVAVMAHALPPETPPLSVKQRLLERIAQAADRAETPLAAMPVDRPKTGYSWFGTIGWACAVLLAVVLAMDYSKETQKVARLEEEIARLHLTVAEKEEAMAWVTARQTHLVAMQGEEPIPSAAAKLFWNPETHVGFLVAFGLPAIPTDKVYQLWAIAEATSPIDAGIFSLDSEGIGQLKMKPLPHLSQPVQLFAITVEPAGGSPGPTSAIQMKGVVDSQTL